MLKNWKSLFVKTQDEETDSTPSGTESFSFPVSDHTTVKATTGAPPPPVNDPVVDEVIEVYESGLESINMPGYDFYEFYKTVISTGHPGPQTYQMAYQMAKTLDNTITAQKLMTDAEFYISKINEVHGQYVMQGQQKLNALQEKKNLEKGQLQKDIDHGTMRISQLRAELQQLEAEVNQKKSVLAKIDENLYPQEKSVREKLIANDMARKVSIDKLNGIKQGILQFIKA